MADPLEILQQYWGFGSFRKGQETIVSSIIRGDDTLALLPTGGGKSICFQVPALCTHGLCVVVSPLLALMHDQVENLHKRGIKAAALTSSMGKREMERTMSDAIHLRIRFLYVSPERLQNEVFIDRYRHMPVTLLAVDEAHCISQWGYDFRPAYLEIAKLREFHPAVPIIALTATATPEVVNDIQEKLQFRRKNSIAGSFYRENLAYVVMQEEDKESRMLELIRKIPGQCIVYCGTRLRTKEVAQWLSRQGLKAAHYHAGMSVPERDKAYRSWMNDEVRIICATNAFGMGIDKADVRLVLHADVPPNIESYFQEAGRAGRDGRDSYAVLLYHASDTDKLIRQVETKYPDKEFIRLVYHHLCEYLRIAIGSGKDTTHPLDIPDFIKRYALRYTETYYALRILDSAGYISLSEDTFLPSRLLILSNNTGLYSFQVAHPEVEPFVKLLLRMYGGLFEQYTAIHEEDISRHSKLTIDEVSRKLEFLRQYEMVDYQPRNDLPRLTFLLGRSKSNELRFSREIYEDRKQVELTRMRAMLSYLEMNTCRSAQLLHYFGERESGPCGKCDVCRAKNRRPVNQHLRDTMNDALDKIALSGDRRISELPALLPQYDSTELIEYVRWKIERGEWALNSNLELIKQTPKV